MGLGVELLSLSLGVFSCAPDHVLTTGGIEQCSCLNWENKGGTPVREKGKILGYL